MLHHQGTQKRRGSSALALILILLLGGTAVVIALNARAKANQAEANLAKARAQGERKDIFGDLPPDVPKERKHQSTTLLNQAEVALPTDEAAWNAANDYADRAKIALKEALAAQEVGARDQAKKKGAEAQELYTRALEKATPWLESLAAEYGRDNPLVVRVDKVTSTWAREIVFLKKSAGM